MDYSIKVFYYVATYGGFSKAADALFVSQSNISYTISKLEKELGVSLFERQRNGVKLTKAGEKLLVYSSDYLERWNKLMVDMRWFQNNKDITLNIGTTYLLSDYIILHYLQPLRDTAKLKMITNMVVGNSHEILAALHNGKVDFAFVSEPIDDEDYIVKTIFNEEIALVVNADHPWRQLESVTLDMLSTMPFVSREEGSGTRRLIESSLIENGFSPSRLNTSFIGSNYSMVLQAVKNGLGFSLVPYTAIQKDKEGLDKNLYIVPIKGFSIHRKFLFVTLPSNIRNKDQKKFYKSLLELLNIDSVFPQ